MTNEEKAALPHVIIVGDPGAGFELYGPFPNEQAAISHADGDGDLDHDWWVLPILPVEPVVLSLCDECGEECEEIVSCPDGAEICRACFNAGQH